MSRAVAYMDKGRQGNLNAVVFNIVDMAGVHTSAIFAIYSWVGSFEMRIILVFPHLLLKIEK